MSGPSATTGFLSVLMEMATQGLDCRELLRDAVGRLTAEMFMGEERQVFEAACILLDQGHMPTAFTTAQQAELPPLKAGQIKTQGQELYGDLSAAVKGVLWQHVQASTIQRLTAALQAASKGDLGAAQVLAQEAAEGTLPNDPAASLRDYHAYDVDALPEPRLITTTLRQLNEDLGGGLGAGGTLCMSLIAAPSGVGKSSFVFQQIPHWLLTEKHWVLYASGEMTADYVFGQVTRLHARLSEAQYSLRTPKFHSSLRRGNAQLRQAIEQGRFTALDEDFTLEGIRALARIKAKELKKAREAGTVTDTARLIVIVDNWDNLFESYDFSKLREDQVFQREMQRFARQASEYGYHHMNLVQTNGEAEDAKGPAEAHQLQGSKKLNAKSSHQITLYRARDAQAVAEALSEARSPDWVHPQIGVRKARGGGRCGVRRYATNSAVGSWHDLPSYPEF